MKFAYQISTPDVNPAPNVTAYQSDLETSMRRLSEVGYDGAELMVCNPAAIDVAHLERLAQRYNLGIAMVCTGEVYGQDLLTLSSIDDAVRNEAIARGRAAIDVAEVFGTQINIGRLRGRYLPEVDRKTTYDRAFEAMCELSDYAAAKKVIVALEPVNSRSGMNFINTTQEGMEMVDKIGRDNYKIMIDSAHMIIEDLDILASIRESKDYFTYVHLTEEDRKYPGASGTIDFAAFINTLKEVGYDGYVSVEVLQLPDQETALLKSYEFIKPLL